MKTKKLPKNWKEYITDDYIELRTKNKGITNIVFLERKSGYIGLWRFDKSDGKICSIEDVLMKYGL